MTNEKHGGPALHTSEPWHTGGNGTLIYDKDGWGIASATVFHGRQEPETSAENARRIVACVNRLAGFTTEQIEDYGYDLAGVADWIAREQYLIEQQNRVLRQRDELFAALKIYEQAFEAMFAQCGSNGMKDAWGKTVNVSLLNEAHYHAEYAIRNSNK